MVLYGRFQLRHCVSIKISIGYLVGVLTNNWIDTDEERTGEFFSFLNHHFHAVVESCREGVRKPDQAAFKIACERLKTDPQEVSVQKIQKIGLGIENFSYSGDIFG